MPKVLFSFFSGVGLLDLGFENADYDIVFVNEYRQSFLDGYIYARRNRNFIPQYGYHCCSIDDYLSVPNLHILQERVQQQKDAGNTVGFIGGPPCPDFSVAGKNKGRDGENGRLTKSYIDLIIKCRPDFFLFENVRGLVKTERHKQYFNELKHLLHDHGYNTSDAIVNSLEFGTPQDRERVILIGVSTELSDNLLQREDVQDLPFPWRAHTRYNIQDLRDMEWPTTQAFIENSKRRFKYNVPRELTVQAWFEKNNVCHHPNAMDKFHVKAGKEKIEHIKEGDTSRKSFKRLHRWRYSPTAAYGNNEVHLHPYKKRRISVSEAMAIQSLPAWFELPNTMRLSWKFKTIGNGVPYLLAYGIAITLSEFIDMLLAEEE